MDAKLLNYLSNKEQILINRCRIFLQVECLSDICTADGDNIQPEWLDCNTTKDSCSTKSGRHRETLGKKLGASGRNS
jgi:hypothetical protein